MLLESTANGHNEFKELWDRPQDGEARLRPVLRSPGTRTRATDGQLTSRVRSERFVIGEHVFGEDEPDLVERYGLTSSSSTGAAGRSRTCARPT